MQLNLFLISASAKEQNFPADFNLTQAVPASAQTLFSTNIQPSYSPTLQLYFLILICNNSFPLPAGFRTSPCPGENCPSPFHVAARVSLTLAANARNTAFIIIPIKKMTALYFQQELVFFFSSPLHPKPVLKYNSCQLLTVLWNATINGPTVIRQSRGQRIMESKCVFSASITVTSLLPPNQESSPDNQEVQPPSTEHSF